MEMFSKEINAQVAALVRKVDALRAEHKTGPCRYHNETTVATPEGEDDIILPPMSESHPECLAAIKAIEAEIHDIRGGRSAVHTGLGPAVGAPIPRPE